MSKAATIIAERLWAAGCRRAFGIPGGEVIELMDALRSAGIEVTLTKHENAAGFMAEGVHHRDGAPGILIATIGPGLANAVNVIANAQQDRVPLVVLTGCVGALDQHSYTHQVFDHSALLAPVTKAVFKVEQGAVGLIVDKALAACRDGQPGPVLLDVPIDVQRAEQGETPRPHRVAPAPMAPADGPELERARRWLAEAERPLVIAGVDALNAGSEAAVAAFCRRVGAPLITSYKAKGVLPEDDPLSLGGAGLSPKADRHLLPLVQQADLVVLAGYDPIEMRSGWRDPWAAGARVVEFSAVPNTHYMHQAAISFIGHVGAGLERFASAAALRRTWPNGAPTATRATLKAAFPSDEAWGPAAVVAVLREVLPREAVITADSGAHRILLSQMWDCYEPRGLLQSSAFCTMGCALPLAMGRKLAEPERPIVAFTGDAGLEMILGELATLRDLALPLLVVVFVDEELALIEMKQRGAGYEKMAVSFGGTDFAAVAVALGGHGATVTDRESLRREAREALGRDRFTVIAARIGQQAYDGRF